MIVPRSTPRLPAQLVFQPPWAGQTCSVRRSKGCSLWNLCVPRLVPAARCISCRQKWKTLQSQRQRLLKTIRLSVCTLPLLTLSLLLLSSKTHRYNSRTLLSASQWITVDSWRASFLNPDTRCFSSREQRSFLLSFASPLRPCRGVIIAGHWRSSFGIGRRCARAPPLLTSRSSSHGPQSHSSSHSSETTVTDSNWSILRLRPVDFQWFRRRYRYTRLLFNFPYTVTFSCRRSPPCTGVHDLSISDKDQWYSHWGFQPLYDLYYLAEY